MQIGSQPISERIKEVGKKENEGISVNKTVLAGKRTTMTPMTFQMTHSGSRFAILNQEENEIATGDIKESATKITEKIQAIPKPKERVNFTGTIYTIGETSGVQKKPVTRTKKKVQVYLPVNCGKNVKSGSSHPSGPTLHPIVERNAQSSINTQPSPTMGQVLQDTCLAVVEGIREQDLEMGEADNMNLPKHQVE